MIYEAKKKECLVADCDGVHPRNVKQYQATHGLDENGLRLRIALPRRLVEPRRGGFEGGALSEMMFKCPLQAHALFFGTFFTLSKCRYLVAVAAGGHATPSSAMRLGTVVKPENALVIIAAPNKVEVARGE
jgi:hypothetical protein